MMTVRFEFVLLFVDTFPRFPVCHLFYKILKLEKEQDI